MPETKLSTKTKNHHSAGKFLTFTLHHEFYGIDVSKVREIIRHAALTPMPLMPAFVRGVINQRGKIIPVMDLRTRFEFTGATGGKQICIVVAQVKLPEGKSAPIGLVVDGVEEVIPIVARDTETPDFGRQIYMDYIAGIAKVKGQIKTLRDVDEVTGIDTSKNLCQAAQRHDSSIRQNDFDTPDNLSH